MAEPVTNKFRVIEVLHYGQIYFNGPYENRVLEVTALADSMEEFFQQCNARGLGLGKALQAAHLKSSSSDGRGGYAYKYGGKKAQNTNIERLHVERLLTQCGWECTKSDRFVRDGGMNTVYQRWELK